MKKKKSSWRPLNVISGCRLPVKTRKLNGTKRTAKATFKKDKRVNIRISRKDLEAIQTRVLEEGIPYQTLMASILHKYMSGRLAEKPY